MELNDIIQVIDYFLLCCAQSPDGVLVENFEPKKEAKTDATPEENFYSKSTEKNDDHQILEKGDIVFMCKSSIPINFFTFHHAIDRLDKPKLGVDEASSIDDVQLFHVLLIPEEKKEMGDDQALKKRLVKIGKKQLPANSGDRFWAFIETADDDMEKMEENLQPQTYDTATVGTRTVKADRIAGKGKYLMAKHEENRTVLGYVLESPDEVGDVQNAFNIVKEASFSLAVKNPQKKNPPAAGLTRSQKAEFPEEIQRKFGSYQWLPGRSFPPSAKSSSWNFFS